MYILHATETPHGAAANAHRIGKIEIQGGIVSLVINSFATEESEMLLWQDTHVAPMDQLTSGIFPQNLHDWIISNTGPFTGGQIMEDPLALDLEKAKLLVSLDDLRKRKMYSGCETNFGRVDTDDTSMRNILTAYQRAALSIGDTSYVQQWRLEDNSSVDLTAEQMIQLGNQVFDFVSNCYKTSWSVKTMIQEATQDTIGDVLIGNGWPV